MDDTNQALNVQRTAAYCMAHPRWRLSLQTHKLIGFPKICVDLSGALGRDFNATAAKDASMTKTMLFRLLFDMAHHCGDAQHRKLLVRLSSIFQEKLFAILGPRTGKANEQIMALLKCLG